MKASEILNEYYNPSKDDRNRLGKSDTRRPKLTLKHLNALRKSKELKRTENARRKEFIPKMYSINTSQ